MLNTTQVKDLVRTRFNVAKQVWLNKCYSNYTEIDDKRNMGFLTWDVLTDTELKALEKEVGCKRVKQTGVYKIGCTVACFVLQCKHNKNALGGQYAS